MSPQASLEKYGDITNKFFRLTGILSHGVEISESDWPMLNAILTETAEYLTEFRGVPTDNRLYDFAFKQAVTLRNRVHGLISSRESYLIDLHAARTILSFAETFSVTFTQTSSAVAKPYGTKLCFAMLLKNHARF